MGNHYLLHHKAAKTTLKITVISALGTLAALPASAVQQYGFADFYAPSAWSFSTGGNGLVDTSGAPASIYLQSSNAGSFNPITTTYTTIALASGKVSFEWSYGTNDFGGSFWDPFSIILNGVSSTVPDYSLGGAFALDVSAGDIFGFEIFSRDDFGGEGYVTISNFSAPAVPTPMPIFGAAAAIGWSRRLRRRVFISSVVPTKP